MLKDNKYGVTFAQGFKAAGIKAGIKKSGNRDLAVIYSEHPAAVAGTFTQNAVAAASVRTPRLFTTAGEIRTSGPAASAYTGT